MARYNLALVFLGLEHIQHLLSCSPPGHHVLQHGLLSVPGVTHNREYVNTMQLAHAHPDPATLHGVAEILGRKRARVEPFLDATVLKRAKYPWANAVG